MEGKQNARDAHLDGVYDDAPLSKDACMGAVELDDLDGAHVVTPVDQLPISHLAVAVEPHLQGQQLK